MAEEEKRFKTEPRRGPTPGGLEEKDPASAVGKGWTVIREGTQEGAVLLSQVKGASRRKKPHDQ